MCAGRSFQERSIFSAGGGPILQHSHEEESSKESKRRVRQNPGSCWQVQSKIWERAEGCVPGLGEQRPSYSADHRASLQIVSAKGLSSALGVCPSPHERTLGLPARVESSVISKIHWDSIHLGFIDQMERGVPQIETGAVPQGSSELCQVGASGAG